MKHIMLRFIMRSMEKNLMAKNENKTKGNKIKDFIEKLAGQLHINKRVIYFFLTLIVFVSVFLGWRIFSSSNKQNTDGYQTVELSRSELIAIVGATGIVEANQTATLNWQTNGRVEEIFVEIGENVKKGAILASLEEISLPQSIILAKADFVSAQRELEELIESDTKQSQAYYDLLQAEKDLKTAEEDRDQWNYNNADQNRIEEARQTFIDAEEKLKNVEKQLAQTMNLDNDDQKRLDIENAFEEAKLNRDKALRDLNYLSGKSYDQQVAEDFAKYDISLARLEDAQREWGKVKDGPNIDDIKAAEARVAAAQATIALASLETPFAGTLTEVHVKGGDDVTTGSPGFRIDDLSRLIVEVEVPEVDINQVKTDQKAELSFDAILAKTYQGKVVEVALVGTDIQGEINFVVKVELLDTDEQIKPGMTAAVNIIVNKLENVLAVPNRAVRLNNGDRVVYILKNGELVEVEITLGASSDTITEIISGDLQEGDLIVLNPPFDYDTGGGPPGFMR